MRVHYSSDGEIHAIMELDELVTRFDQNGGWKFRHNETDMRDELSSRGWYEGLHECGRYLVLNIDKLGLAPKADNAMPSFEQFQASRKWCDNLRTIAGWEEYEIGEGYVYWDFFVIEKHKDGFQLTIENTSKIVDLATAERELYEWLLACGGFTA